MCSQVDGAINSRPLLKLAPADANKLKQQPAFETQQQQQQQKPNSRRNGLDIMLTGLCFCSAAPASAVNTAVHMLKCTEGPRTVRLFQRLTL